MSQRALQRTIRRCTAVLAIPLSLFPVLFVASLERRYTESHAFINLTLEVGDEVALLVLLGAVAYLVGSVGRQAMRANTSPDSENATE